MLLNDLLKNVKCTSKDFPANLDVKGIAYDSRKTAAGYLFVAIPGTTVDGAKYIPEAVKNGVVAVVLEREADVPDGIAKILVKNARQALATIAANFYGHPSKDLKIIGITGTNGKTTVAYLIESILKEAGFKVGVIGTINSKIGNQVVAEGLTTPAPLELEEILLKMKKDGVQYVVMETSSHALDQERLYGIDFNIAIFTNLTPEHLDYHRTMENYLVAKRKLFANLGKLQKKKTFAIMNADDKYSRNVLGNYAGKVLTYSVQRPSNLQALKISGDSNTISFKAGGITINSGLIGIFNVYNLLAAIQVGLVLKIDKEKIQRGLEALQAIPGRMEEIKNKKGFRVFVDFAHTPDALQKILDTAKALIALQEQKGRILLVFGCPGSRDRQKRPVMAKIAAERADIAIATTDDPHREDPEAILEEVVAGWHGLPEAENIGGAQTSNVKTRLYKITDRSQAIEKALALAKPQDIVLIAGRGHEKHQDFNGKKVEIDDRVVVRDLFS